MLADAVGMVRTFFQREEVATSDEPTRVHEAFKAEAWEPFPDGEDELWYIQCIASKDPGRADRDEERRPEAQEEYLEFREKQKQRLEERWERSSGPPMMSGLTWLRESQDVRGEVAPVLTEQGVPFWFLTGGMKRTTDPCPVSYTHLRAHET